MNGLNVTPHNTSFCNESLLKCRSQAERPLPECYACTSPCIIKAVELIYVIGVLANILVISRVIKDKRLRKPTFVAIGCLAVSDTLFVMTELVIAVDVIINHKTMCPVPRPQLIGPAFRLVNGACWFAANGHLTLLAVVRFILIVSPIRAHAYLTIKKVVVLSILTWVLGIVIFAFGFAYDITQDIEDSRSAGRTTVVWTVVYLIPLALTCVLHLVKLRLVRNTRSAKKCNHGNAALMTHTINRMTSIILFVIFAAFVFPLPKFVIEILIRVEYDFSSKFDRTLYHNVSVLLLYLNNSINPFVYALFSKPFRESMIGMIQCRNSLASPDDANSTGALEDTRYSETSFVTDSPRVNKRLDR